MRQRDIISGFFFLFIAIVLYFQAIKLPVWGELGPTEGFFPLCLSLVFGGLSLLIVILAFFKPVEAGKRTRIVDPHRGKFFAYVALFFGFGILLPIAGYTLILGAFLVIILRWVEKHSWKTTVLLTLLLMLGSNILFARILNISMPEGMLSSALRLWP